MSGSTRNYEEWLDAQGLESPDEIADLYNSIANNEGVGSWNVKTAQKGATLIDSSVGGDTLILWTDQERQNLMSAVAAYKDDPDMGMDAWVAYRRAMDKDD